MQLTITGRHVSVTEAVKNYASDKLKHVIAKHNPDRITKAHIILDVQKYQHTAEIEVHGPRNNIYSKVTTEDMYASIDKATDKIESQLVKLKTKFDKRKHIRPDTIRVPREEDTDYGK